VTADIRGGAALPFNSKGNIMQAVTFEIPGKPFAKQRPRFSRRSGRTYTPGETVSFERTVGQIALEHFPKPITGPVKLTIWATFQPPVSWSKKKTAELMNRPHTQKPDLDNVAKAICDGLNRIAFVDDGQIYEIVMRKVWGPQPRTVIEVEAVQDNWQSIGDLTAAMVARRAE
jgi:Holliday junction resolvase RusA-like endonuclease